MKKLSMLILACALAAVMLSSCGGGDINCPAYSQVDTAVAVG